MRLGQSTRWAFLGALLLGILLPIVPLLSLPGAESSLVVGILLPPLVVWASVDRVWALRARAGRPGVAEVLLDSISLASALWALAHLPLVLTWLASASCRPPAQWWFPLLGPLCGCLLAACCGALAAAFASRLRWARSSALALPLLSIVYALVEFWATPGIFAYGSFFGYFPGTPYDEESYLPLAYFAFRFYSLLCLVGVLGLFVAFWHSPPGGSPWRALERPVALSGLVALALAALVLVYGDHLGFRASPRSMHARLGAFIEGRLCRVDLPKELSPAERRRLLFDCEFHVWRHTQSLRLGRSEKIRVFIFRSEEEKREAMGAGSTFIAKPWRRESYLQVQPWPHPVLGHEIAHVVLGRVARGPFRVGGALAGWWPNPALIEGAAEALQWQARDHLSPHQWARALLELQRLPPMSKVIGLGFLGQSGRFAYTLSGSFYRYLFDRFGVNALVRLYRGEAFEAVLHRPLSELERDWKTFLRSVPVPDETLELAKSRFRERSIFFAPCPHETAALQEELATATLAGDRGESVRICRRLLHIDAGDDRSRLLLARALVERGERERAKRQLERLSRSELAESNAGPIAELLGDIDWRSGKENEALAHYRHALLQPLSEEMGRALEVKVASIEGGWQQSALMRRFFFHPLRGSPAPAYLLFIAQRLDALRGDGLAPYLVGRQLFMQQEYAAAAEVLEDALERELPSPRLQREAERLYGTALLGAENYPPRRRRGAKREARHRRRHRSRALRLGVSRSSLSEADYSSLVFLLVTKRRFLYSACPKV